MIDDTEMGERESFEGPAIIIKQRSKNPGSCPGRKKSSDRIFHVPVERRLGQAEYWKATQSRVARFRNKPGFPDYRRSGTPDGMSKQEAQKQWEIARQSALEVMEKMKEAGMLPATPTVETANYHELKTDNDRAEAAVLAALEIMASPMNQELKLKAATLLLNFCKAKPSSKQEVTVKTAQDWFANLEDDSDDE